MPMPIQAIEGLRADTLPLALLRGSEPLVLRGLVADWPAVHAAEGSALSDAAASPAAPGAAASPAAPDAAATPPGGITGYLRALDVGATVGAWFGPPAIDGRFGYSSDLAGFNFSREKLPFRSVLDLLERHQADAEPPAIYVGSTTIDTCVPGFRAGNDLAAPLLAQIEPLASLWLGNRNQVAVHQDLPDNLACVVAGRRRFTLFPPDQVGKLHIGPLEHTLAGQPTSLVDLARPDLQRFPRFAQALAQARVAELAPGDALFIPSMWWHGVQSLAPVNLLVNYWWRQSPAHMDSPMGALLHTIMTVRDLPPAQRAAWRSLFAHYVFDADADTAAHIPPAARHVLAPLDDLATRGLRARLLRRLNR